MPRIEPLSPLKVGVAVFAAAVLAASTAHAQSAGSGGESSTMSGKAAAEAVIERLHEAFIASAAAGGDRDSRYAQLLPVVRDTHDLPFIAQLTIRRQWRDLDETARQRFVAAFERLSVMTYATRFSGVTADTFRIVDAESLEGGRVGVDAEIRRAEAPSIPLEYILQHSGSEWRIVNILADGVSDLALKRAQYQRVLRDGGTVDDVIALIESETAAL
jgi:phospholipid transport system substrate-binding protein